MAVDLKDHQPNRNNQFIVKDFDRVPGTYCVVNVRTGLVATRPSGMRYWKLSLVEAEEKAKRLNGYATKKHICKGCRHIRFADEIVEGRCAECRAKK